MMEHSCSDLAWMMNSFTTVFSIFLSSSSSLLSELTSTPSVVCLTILSPENSQESERMQAGLVKPPTLRLRVDLVTVLLVLGLLDLELRSDLLLRYEVRLVRVLWGEVEEELSKLRNRH